MPFGFRHLATSVFTLVLVSSCSAPSSPAGSSAGRTPIAKAESPHLSQTGYALTVFRESEHTLVESLDELDQVAASRAQLTGEDAVGRQRYAVLQAALFPVLLITGALVGLVITQESIETSTQTPYVSDGGIFHPVELSSLRMTALDLSEAEPVPEGSPQSQRIGEQLAVQVRSIVENDYAPFIPAVGSDLPAEREIADGVVRSRYIVVLRPGAGSLGATIDALQEEYAFQAAETLGQPFPAFYTELLDTDTAFALALDSRVAVVEENTRAVSPENASADADEEAEDSRERPPHYPPEYFPRSKRDDDGPCKARYPEAPPDYEPSPWAVPWNLDRIDQLGPELDCEYEPAGTGAGVDVYVFGDGIDANHPAFMGANLSLDFPTPGRVRRHGTAVASVVHAVAPDATIVPVGIYSNVVRDPVIVDGRQMQVVINNTNAWLRAKARQWIHERIERTQNPSVVLATEGATRREALLERWLTRKTAQDALFISASGNDTDPGPVFIHRSTPARFRLNVGGSYLLGVAGSAEDVAFDGNAGTQINLYAPASAVVVANTRSPAWEFSEGTSFAGPHTAGAAAIYLQHNREAKPNRVRQDVMTPRLKTGSGAVGKLSPPGFRAASLLYVGREWDI